MCSLFLSLAILKVFKTREKELPAKRKKEEEKKTSNFFQETILITTVDLEQDEPDNRTITLEEKETAEENVWISMSACFNGKGT